MKSIITLFCASILLMYSCSETNNTGTDFIYESPNLTNEFDYEELNLPSSAFFGEIIPTNGEFIGRGFVPNTFIGGIFGGNINVSGFGRINNGFIVTSGSGSPGKTASQHLVNITNSGANLGRVLFYDKKLSLNNTIACGSCHHQDKAFTDGVAVSKGFEGRTTSRSSMAIINPILQNNLFWDSRSNSIHDLSLKPVQNHIEMGMEDISYLVKKLNKFDYYPELFEKAYGTTDITKDKISDAISQFLASITTADSKFDRMLAGDATLTQEESLGQGIFFGPKAKCSGCHAGANFSAPDGPNDAYGGGQGSFNGAQNIRGTANIGLDAFPSDQGLQKGNFKIPSLRNIALTAPYMHDGRFNTLEDVLDHYSHGIKENINLDDKFRDEKGRVEGLDLNSLEKRSLIAFLNTLSDHSFITNPKYANPFQD